MTLEIIEDFKQAGIEYIYTPVKAGHALLIDNIAAVLEETYTFLSMK